MKFNWGYKILIVYLAFAGGILYMVYLTTLQNRDLVSENYYEEELAYQKVIDKSAKTAQLSGDVKVNLNQIKREIAETVNKYAADVRLLNIQVKATNKSVAGGLEIKLFCSMNTDRSDPFELNLEVF